MSYNTPELLLVGSASSLVLENLGTSDDVCFQDNPEPAHMSDAPELW
jgi:hypothetical protein